MTEAEWQVSCNPRAMLGHLRGRASDRKLRLFACSCCRRIWHLIDLYLARQCVVVAENFADGLADVFQMMRARRTAGEGTTPRGGKWSYAALLAMEACANVQEDYDFAGETSRLAVQAVDEEEGHTGSGVQERAGQCALLQDIFGNPFRLLTIDSACFTPTVASIAQAAYDDRIMPSGGLDSVRLAVLADALEEGGAPVYVLEHLRRTGSHVRRCWVVDAVLGKK